MSQQGKDFSKTSQKKLIFFWYDFHMGCQKVSKRKKEKHVGNIQWSLVIVNWVLSPIYFSNERLLGPLHVFWQVSFGCWVTWSISSWQKYYKSVSFFPKLSLNDKIYCFSKKFTKPWEIPCGLLMKDCPETSINQPQRFPVGFQ